MAEARRGDLPPHLITLLESAESEAKRTMHDAPSLAHLAVVLAQRDEDGFDAVFGEDSGDRVVQRVRSGGATGGSADEVLQFLWDAHEAGEASQLVERLSAVLDPSLTAEAVPASEGGSEGDGDPAPDDGASPSGDLRADADSALDAARQIVEPDADPAGAGPVLPRTDRYVAVVEPEPDIEGRARDVDDLLARLGRARPEATLLVGPSGSGRTALMGAVAQRVSAEGYRGPLAGAKVIRVVPELLVLSDATTVLRQIAEDAAALDGPAILVIDDLEVVAGFGAENRVNVGVLVVLRAIVGLAQVPLVAIVDSAFAGRLQALDRELHQELSVLRIEPPSRPVLEEIAERAARVLATHHDVVLPADVVRLALNPPGRHDTDDHPALAIKRLDGAAATASLREDRYVTDVDLALGDDPSVVPPDADHLTSTLARRVLGQAHAVERISSRLALTRARLDLRPDRPDGVFLFVGPTGVGKTELARAVADALFGDERRMIRLDMSEYAGEWAISQLIGPPPGYVGSTDPEGWLTTKVRHQPDTVLLLDEIEKADPRVWNTFLQVFDVGRLTDSHGRVADFSRVVVIMTSNMGADAFSAPAVGFGRGDGAADVASDEERVLEQVRSQMAPELVNRLDDVIVFRPLDREAIRNIAAKEVDDVVGKLVDRGYRLAVDDEVVDLLAHTGYSKAYGARHLQRNIERLFLQPLAQQHARDVRAVVRDGAISWEPVEDDGSSEVAG